MEEGCNFFIDVSCVAERYDQVSILSVDGGQGRLGLWVGGWGGE